jgi:hypothetical protein
MYGHVIDNVLRRRAEDFVVSCRCGWTSPAVPSRAMAEAAFAYHQREAQATVPSGEPVTVVSSPRA